MATYQLVVPAPFPRMRCLLGVQIEDDRLVELDYLFSDIEPVEARTPLASRVAEQLAAYFGDSACGFDLPIELKGTPFQQRVWSALRAIPVGKRVTYGALAKELGSSPRAIGNACRTNPLPIIVPCHRVVAASGLGGYAGRIAGRNMRIKRWLLAHEASQG